MVRVRGAHHHLYSRKAVGYPPREFIEQPDNIGTDQGHSAIPIGKH
jgi:hypothetical protein